MARPLLIAPSILSADFSRLGAQVDAVLAAGADWIHVDVMDGRFVPNLTIGAPVVSALRTGRAAFLDCHLMIEQPERLVEDFARAGADCLTVHVEACPHLHRNLEQIRGLSHHAGGRIAAGVSLNPHTPITTIEHVLELCDLVLIMSVNPGFGGQRFIDAVRPKLRALRERIDRLGLPTRLQVDGGVGPGNVRALVEDGADVVVAGSAVFSGPHGSDYAAAIAELRRLAAAP